MTIRNKLIHQLRFAIDQCESTSNDVAEFDIGDTSFCFELDEEGFAPDVRAFEEDIKDE